MVRALQPKDDAGKLRSKLTDTEPWNENPRWKNVFQELDALADQSDRD
jgi:hypothetical protein